MITVKALKRHAKKHSLEIRKLNRYGNACKRGEGDRPCYLKTRDALGETRVAATEYAV